MSDSRSTSTRRRALKYAGLTGLSGVAGLTGLSLTSQPALALSDPVTLPSGLTAGSVTVPSYEIQYAELDTTSDITINYVLRTDAETKTTESHVVSITESTGAVMTGDHTISVPAGEVSLEVQLKHPSVGTVSTQESTTTTVASAIPDSGDLHARYDATELSLNDGDTVSTFSDETGNGHDLTAGTAPTFKTSVINGNPVVRFDGVDDFLDVAFSQQAQPNTIFAVLNLQSFDTNNYESVYDSESSDIHRLRLPNSDNWSIFAGSSLDGGTLDTNNHIHSALFNGSNSIQRLDGGQIASGNAGTNPLNGFTLGDKLTQGIPAEVDVGEILIYPQDKSGIFSDVESYLSDKWGITV